MKKLLLLSARPWWPSPAGQKNKAHISGTFSGISKDTIYLEMLTTKGRTVVDSTVTNQQGNYRFTVSPPVAAPTFYNIVYKQSSIPVIVSPGEKVKVNSLCDLGRNYTVEGSDDSKLLKEFNTMYSNGVRSLDSLANLYSETRPTPDNDARRTALLREYTQRYVKTNANTSPLSSKTRRPWPPFMRSTSACPTTKRSSMRTTTASTTGW